MNYWQYKRKLWKLQSDRERINRSCAAELKALPGDKREEARASWAFEYFMVKEEIEELQSEYLCAAAERHMISIPKLEEGAYWDRMRHVGDRLILTAKVGKSHPRKLFNGRSTPEREYISGSV